MRMSSRAAWALGLGLLGVAGLVGRSFGQAEKSAGQAAVKPIPPAIIGCVDMDAIFKGYDKVKFVQDQLKGEALAKQAQLQQVNAQLKTITKKLDSLTPGSADYKKEEAEFARLKSQLETDTQLAQRDFQQKEAEALATLYKEIAEMVAAVAKVRKITYVVRVSNEPINGSDPNSVMAAMARSMVYSDPDADITSWVVSNLNRRYNATKDPSAAKASATAPAASGGAVRK
jgi:outer membrane protein